MKLSHDLSEHHQIVSDLFPSISSKDAWEKYKLSDEQISFFNTYGFLSDVKLLEDRQVGQTAL
jgi:hypothetical protein